MMQRTIGAIFRQHRSDAVDVENASINAGADDFGSSVGVGGLDVGLRVGRRVKLLAEYLNAPFLDLQGARLRAENMNT